MTHSPWADWLGRREILRDRITDFPARALAATLNRDDAHAFVTGAPIPPLWTWLYFLQAAQMRAVGADGHPARGGFLPPVPQPRRMWAGSRCAFHAPVRIGDDVEKVSVIEKISEKEGKSGVMTFVTVRHSVSAQGNLAMEEEQDIVYIDIPERFTPPPASPLLDCAWGEEIAIDPVLLFRFSALTFNGHRIHYDRTYATEVERYPGLVVHGPLQAIILFDAAARRMPARRAAQFSFRGVRPLFDFETVSVHGRDNEDGALALYTTNGDGAIGMQATLTWSAP
ncbi:MAG: acyl-CoA dehydrogenase [Alphaproteobacteria bacterium]|nr:acyl-CoA dehydrogenase [Alphaproteobacteria bacterium]